MQWLAHASGLAYYNRQLYLNIHPTYGTWIAFRAASEMIVCLIKLILCSVILNMDGPSDDNYIELKDPCAEIAVEAEV